jgi:hypothetical protein
MIDLIRKTDNFNRFLTTTHSAQTTFIQNPCVMGSVQESISCDVALAAESGGILTQMW